MNDSKWLEKATQIVRQLPSEIFWSINRRGKLKIQAKTHDEAARIKALCPASANSAPMVWKRTHNKRTGWNYTADYGDLLVKIYAIREAPPQCTPIKETKVVKKRVPIEWEEQEVEKEVIVGWDCSNGKGDDYD